VAPSSPRLLSTVRYECLNRTQELGAQIAKFEFQRRPGAGLVAGRQLPKARSGSLGAPAPHCEQTDSAGKHRHTAETAEDRSEERRVGKERRSRWGAEPASKRRHTRLVSDWSSDVCSSDLRTEELGAQIAKFEFQRRPGAGLVAGRQLPKARSGSLGAPAPHCEQTDSAGKHRHTAETAED